MDFITNRLGQRIAFSLISVKPQNGLAIVMPGLGGRMEQPHIQTIISCFSSRRINVLTFDPTNSFGKSDGLYEQATFTGYLHDLEDVIAWASQQTWYQEPLLLAGHSLGGLCCALYAEKHPQKVKALAPLSTVVSGQLSLGKHKREEITAWEKTGWREETSSTGKLKRLPWSHAEDRLKYDLLPLVSRLTMPVLLIVGDQDIRTPPKHQQILYDKLPGPKQLHVMKNTPHTPSTPEQLAELKKLFSDWLDSL